MKRHLSLGVLAALIGIGCGSSSSLTGSGGAGGSGTTGGATGTTGGSSGHGGAGTGGHAGTAGGAGGAGGAICGTLVAEYASALQAAQSCDVDTAGQCQVLVSASLTPCSVNCQTYANDATTLNAIKASWVQAGCNNVAVLCPAIACLQPTNAVCTAGDSGAGVCAQSRGSGGAGGHAGGAGGSGGNGGSGGTGGTECSPACGSGSVCVGTGTLGGAILFPNDAGACPSGTHASGATCARDLTYACMPLPSACAGTATCACASSLCPALHSCAAPGAGVLTCIEAVP